MEMTVLKAVVKLLSEKKFGKSTTQKNPNGPSTKMFVRYYIPDISISNTSFMQEYGVDLEKFNTANRLFENETEDCAGNEIKRSGCNGLSNYFNFYLENLFSPSVKRKSTDNKSPGCSRTKKGIL
jgi:hypothetical protein